MPRKILKMVLDLIMTAAIVLLMNLSSTGLQLHEILGLFTGLFFLIHKVMNYQWIKAITHSLLHKSLKAKVKVMYVLDFLLLCSVTVVILSGILISKILFHIDLTSDQLLAWTTLHYSSAYSSLILISVHIGMHWESILLSVKKLLGLTSANRARTVLSRFAAVCIMLLGIKSSADKDVVGNITAPLKGSGSMTANPENIGIYRKDSDNEQIQAVSVSTQATSGQSLEEYLSGLTCTACHRHCLLSSPACARGRQQAATAETEYYNERGDTTGPSQYSDSNISGLQTETDSGNSKTSPLDFIPIMGLFIAGTHYTVVLSKKLSAAPKMDGISGSGRN